MTVKTFDNAKKNKGTNAASDNVAKDKVKHEQVARRTRAFIRTPFFFKKTMASLLAPVLHVGRFKTADKGLRRVFPQSDVNWRKQISKASAKQTLMNLMGVCHLNAHIFESDDGLKSIVEEAKQGKGGVILCPHTGIYDAVTWYLNKKGVPTETIFGAGKDGKRETENTIIETAAEELEIPFVERGSNSILGLVKAISEGRWVVFHMDLRADGVNTQFFGFDTQVPTTPFFIAQKLGCSAYLHHTLSGKQKQSLFFNKLPQREDLFGKARMEAEAKTTMEYLEQVIRKNPTQWIWHYNRWK